MSTEFTETAYDHWLVERLHLRLIATLLTTAGKCSSGWAKSAHVVSHLPTETGAPVEERSGGEEQQKTSAGGPLKGRNFTLLFGGQTISVMGDALYLVALPWLVLTTGGSAQELGMVLAAYGIPRALSMLVGG